jgi:hypothetical protein
LIDWLGVVTACERGQVFLVMVKGTGEFAAVWFCLLWYQQRKMEKLLDWGA